MSNRNEEIIRIVNLSYTPGFLLHTFSQFNDNNLNRMIAQHPNVLKKTLIFLSKSNDNTTKMWVANNKKNTKIHSLFTFNRK